MRFVMILKTQSNFRSKPSFLFVIYQMVDLQAIMMIDIVEVSNDKLGFIFDEYADCNIIAELEIEGSEYKSILQYKGNSDDSILH